MPDEDRDGVTVPEPVTVAEGVSADVGIAVTDAVLDVLDVCVPDWVVVIVAVPDTVPLKDGVTEADAEAVKVCVVEEV